MLKNISADWLSSKIATPTRQAIISQMTILINNNELPPGTLLPSVRTLADTLGISPATVSAAWQVLKKHQMIRGNGKEGVRVIGKPTVTPSLRFADLNKKNETFPKLDLSYSPIDPILLPNPSKAIVQASKIKTLNSSQFLTIYPPLEKAIQPFWPYLAESFMCVHDSFDALDFLLNVISLPGASIAIEDPTAFTHLGMLRKMGVNIIPVACDRKGPLPVSLAEALRKNPIAFIYQPRNNIASNHVLNQRRLAQLAKLLKTHHALIIEHDMMGDISAHSSLSLGSYYPDRTVYIRSYLKTYGHDLNLAVLSASKQIIQQIQYYRGAIHSWPSRLLQHALAWLINDKTTQQQLEQARVIYAQRYNRLIDLLRKRGLPLPRGDGLSLWLPVRSSEYAIKALAVRDIIAISGDHFGINIQPHIRISTATLTEEQANSVADAIMRAIKPPVVLWRMQGVVL